MYPPAPAAAQPPPTTDPPVPPVVTRAGITGWRLVVAGCAFFGVYTVAYDPMLGWRDLMFLSQLGSLVAAILYFLMAPVPLLPMADKLEPAVAWVRGSLASMMLLICIASIFILGSGDLDQIGFLFEHLLTPLIVAADFVLVGRFSARTKAWHPVTWIGMPLLYLILVNLSGEAQQVYGGILDPANSEFFMYVGMFLVTAIIFGYVLFGLAKLRGLVAANIGGQPATVQQWPAQRPGPYGAPQYPAHGQQPPGPVHGSPAYGAAAAVPAPSPRQPGQYGQPAPGQAASAQYGQAPPPQQFR